MLKEKREITGEIETTGEPGSCGDIQLGPTFVPEALHVSNRSPKRLSVGGLPVADAAEILDRPDNLPRLNIPEETGACGRIREGLRSGRTGKHPYRKDGGPGGGKLKGHDGDESEQEEQQRP